MITVFARNYGPAIVQCNYSTTAIALDGTNDYLDGNNDSHWPFFVPQSNSTTQMIASIWVKSDYVSAVNGLKFIMGQNIDNGGGNSTNQFFRIAYAMRSGSGVNQNRLFVTYRDNGTSNMMERVYQLHANTAITGSTSITDFWQGTNTNINTNVNGFVHICVVMTLPQLGSSFSSQGSIDTYWNGQRLTNTFSNVNAGSISGTFQTVYGTLGTNAANLAGNWFGKIDEVLTTSDTTGGTTDFKNAFGLTTPDSIASFLWNNGCPGDLSDPASAQWDNYYYRFENSYNTEAGNFPFTPVNGASFTTDHA